MIRDRKQVELSEVNFYTRIYGEHLYNPLGYKLKTCRDLKLLKSLVKDLASRKILSIGCGNGLFELLLSPFAREVYAIDISPEAIQIAECNKKSLGIENVFFQCKSFYDLDREQKFDGIVCLSFLHHVPESDFEEFLGLIFNLLKPNSFLYTQDPNVHGILRKVGRVILRENYDKYHTPDERELDPEELKNVLGKLGFNNIKIEYIDLTLIPFVYMFPKGFKWLMYFSLVIDRLWSKGPFLNLGSGFSQICWKPN